MLYHAGVITPASYRLFVHLTPYCIAIFRQIFYSHLINERKGDRNEKYQ